MKSVDQDSGNVTEIRVNTPLVADTMPFIERLQVAAYMFLPLLIIIVAIGLLYTYVDESYQPSIQVSLPPIVIAGSGSSLVSTTYWRWIKLFSEHTLADATQVSGKISYTSAETTIAEQGFFSGDSIFGALDSDVLPGETRYFLSDDPSQNLNASSVVDPASPQHLGTLMFPVFAGALAFAYNVPDLRGRSSLVFDAKTLGDIFCGKITMWSDIAIQTLNPSIQLPKRAIVAVVRSSNSSSSSDVILNYLGKYSTSFKAIVQANATTKWPLSFIQGQDAFELMYMSSVIPYSITYVPLEAALQANTSGETPQIARLVNSQGNIVDPTVSSLTSALDTLNATLPFRRHNYLSITDSNAATAYPVSFLTHVLLNEHYFYSSPGTLVDCERVKTTIRFLTYALTDSEAKQSLLNNGWIPIADNILQNSIRAMSIVTCNKVNVMSQLQEDFDKTAFYTTENYAWDEALTIWNNLGSFKTTTVGFSFYIAFYILLVLSNAIPFVSNMYTYHTDAETRTKKGKRKESLEKSPIKWTFQNWLGIVTQCCTCFQIVYLCLTRSVVVQESGFIDVISYLGLIFDWFWYYILMNVLVFIWIVCMFYTTYLYGFLEQYYPETIAKLTKYHAFLADFLPNFAWIFYNPCVELLAKVFDCRLSLENLTYSNSYHVVCWAKSHWIMVILSISLGCTFTNAVVRYCKILKMLRKDYNFKDKDWNIYLESISKTIVIIMYFNIVNKYFLGISTILNAFLSCCSFFGRPNTVWWFDYIRGSLYAYCTVVYVVLFAFEVTVSPTSYNTRKSISSVLPLAILILTTAVCLIVHSYAMIQFKASLTDIDKKKQEEDLKKFFAAFVDEVESVAMQVTSSYSMHPHERRRSEGLEHQSMLPVPHSPFIIPSTPQGGFLNIDFRRKSDAESIQPVPLGEVTAGSSQNLLTTSQWSKLEELITKAGACGLLEGEELRSIKLALTFEDPIIPIIFSRCNKNLLTFTELLKARVWKVLADSPIRTDRINPPPSWMGSRNVQGSQFSIAASVAVKDSKSRRSSFHRRPSGAGLKSQLYGASTDNMIAVPPLPNKQLLKTSDDYRGSDMLPNERLGRPRSLKMNLKYASEDVTAPSLPPPALRPILMKSSPRFLSAHPDQAISGFEGSGRDNSSSTVTQRNSTPIRSQGGGGDVGDGSRTIAAMSPKVKMSEELNPKPQHLRSNVKMTTRPLSMGSEKSAYETFKATNESRRRESASSVEKVKASMSKRKESLTDDDSPRSTSLRNSLVTPRSRKDSNAIEDVIQEEKLGDLKNSSNSGSKESHKGSQTSTTDS